jgi:tetratricopeptide (TPR) repeat protein
MVFLVVACFPSAQAAGTPSPDSSHASQQLHTYMEQAADAMHKGDLDVAAQNLRRALELDPHSLAALNNLGIVLSREGKPAEAIPLYQRALKVSPEDMATKRNLAVAYFKAERYHLGWSLLQPMAVAHPTDFQILDLAGLCLFAMDRYSDAAQYLERANHADPADAGTLDMLGKAYLRTKNYKALTSVFERTMKLNPNSAAAHIMMGTAYDQTSNRRDAIKEFQAAAEADPNFMGVHSGLGYLSWRQGEIGLAEKEMRSELQRFPSDPALSGRNRGQCPLRRSVVGTRGKLHLRSNLVEQLATRGWAKRRLRWTVQKPRSNRYGKWFNSTRVMRKPILYSAPPCDGTYSRWNPGTESFTGSSGEKADRGGTCSEPVTKNLTAKERRTPIRGVRHKHFDPMLARSGSSRRFAGSEDHASR